MRVETVRQVHAVVGLVLAAHVVLLALFIVIAEPVRPETFAAIDAAHAACAGHQGGPPRLIEYGGTIVAGRRADAPLALPVLGPWPELIQAWSMSDPSPQRWQRGQ
jgi:hypothetical protein